MATSPASDTPQDSQGSLLSTARTLVAGLAWAAAMLIVIGFWVRSKYAGVSSLSTVLSNIFLIAGVVTAGLTAWQVFTLWFKKETPEQKTATLGQQRHLLGLILLAGGIGLIVLSFVLGFGQKPDNTFGFILDRSGESIGVLLFGFIALGTGYFLYQPLNAPTESPIQRLSQKTPVLKMVQIVLGVLALGTFAYLFFVNRKESQYLYWLPELGALFALSILCFSCLLWLNTGAIDEIGTRLFVLIFGGSFGFILFCYSIGRAMSWWRDIFIGGMAAWQGENAWHFWVCAYVQFAALALMFGSFNLARSDIRSNVFLRRVMFGYDTLVQGLLLIEMLAVLNLVIYALVPFTFDWTKSRGAYSLSDSSKNLIGKLSKEAHFFVVMSRNDPSFRDVRNLMDNCQALNNKLSVEYVSPDNEPQKYGSLAEKFPKLRPDSPTSSRGVLMVYGPMPKTKDESVPYEFVSEKSLSDEEGARRPGEKPKRTFKGEAEIMREFKFLVQGRKNHKVYILQGNDEPDVNGERPLIRRAFYVELNKLGYGMLVDRLQKDKFEVVGLNFGAELSNGKEKEKKQKNTTLFVQSEGPDKKKRVPDDCDTLIVSAVPKALPTEVLDAIGQYMERGGKMIVVLDVICDENFKRLMNTGLEPLLKQYGVEVTDTYPLAVRVPLQLNDASMLSATAAADSEHVLARQFAGRSFEMRMLARVLRPVESPGRFKAEPVLQVMKRSNQAAILEKDVGHLREDLDQYIFQLDEIGQLVPRISRENVIVGMAVSDTTKEDKPRMVVVGDTEFLTNTDIMSSKNQVNYSFLVSSLEWLAERESIGAQPKTSTNFTVDPSVNEGRMILVPGWMMFLSLISLGTGIWIVRRR